jgi:hypothetical protein
MRNYAMGGGGLGGSYMPANYQYNNNNLYNNAYMPPLIPNYGPLPGGRYGNQPYSRRRALGKRGYNDLD